MWSETFAAYIARRFGEGAQQKAAFALKVGPSAISYWCRGSTPREKMRRRIERWSKGEVPAAVPPPDSTTNLQGDPDGDESLHARAG